MISYKHSTTGKTVTHRPWTEEERQRLAELIAEGLAVSAIMKELGRDSPGSVRYALRRYEIAYDSARPRFVFRENIAVQVGGGRRWTDEEDAELGRLVRQGLSSKQITQLMPDRTRFAIVKRRKLLNLPNLFRREPRQPVTFDFDDTGEL